MFARINLTCDSLATRAGIVHEPITALLSTVAGAASSAVGAVGSAVGGAVAGASPLALLSTGLGVVGTGISAAGTLAAGKNARAKGEFEAKQAEEQSNLATALGQRSSLEQRRKTQLVQSQLQARAAASGVDPESNSTLNLGGRIAGQGEYEALMDLAKGQDQASGLTNQASASRYQGELAESMAPMTAIGTLASGAGSMYKNLYGYR